MKYLIIFIPLLFISCSHSQSDFEIIDYCDTKFPFEMSDVQMYVPDHETNLFRNQLVYRITLEGDSCTTKEYVIRNDKEIDDFIYQYDRYKSRHYLRHTKDIVLFTSRPKYYTFDMTQFADSDSIFAISQVDQPGKLLVEFYNGDLVSNVVIQGTLTDKF